MRFTRTALRQIEDTLAYVETRSLQGAARLAERISASVALIQELPYAGQATSRPMWRRIVLSSYPYVIFYRVTAQEIVVAHFRHAARRSLPIFDKDRHRP